MSVVNEIIKRGDLLIARVFYDLKTSYSTFYFLKDRFFKKKQDITKLNKVLYF